MKTEIKKLPKSIVELTIEETADNISKYRKKVLENIAQNAQIK
jgi:FKBP-type peptidyl-prolyl cis-trans isomerase (trigger factor)